VTWASKQGSRRWHSISKFVVLMRYQGLMPGPQGDDRHRSRMVAQWRLAAARSRCVYAFGQVARAGRLRQVVVPCGGVLMHCGCSIAVFQCLEGMDWACKACLLLFMGQLKICFFVSGEPWNGTAQSQRHSELILTLCAMSSQQLCMS
jgi:hypothetical protein